MQNKITATNQQNQQQQKFLIPFTISLYAMMFVYAFSVTAVGPLIPEYSEVYGIPLWQSGLLTLFQGIGGVIGLMFGVLLSHKCKRESLLKLLIGAYTASLLALALVKIFAFILILFFLIGISTKLLDSVINAYVSDLHTKKRAAFLGLLHTCFGIGALSAPIIVTSLLNRGISLPYIFVAIGGICVAVQAAYYPLQNKYRIPQPSTETKTRDILVLLKNRDLIFLSLASMSYIIFSTGSSAWLPSYMTTELAVDAVTANYPVYGIWIGVILGRLSYSGLALRFDPRKLLIYSNLAGGIAILAATFINSPIIYIAAYFLTGYFTGAVVPLSVTIANNRIPGYSSSITAVIMLIGSIGLMIIPPIVGLMTETAFWAGMLIMNCFPIITFALMVLVSPNKAESHKIH